jgi:hypothetical protein
MDYLFASQPCPACPACPACQPCDWYKRLIPFGWCLLTFLSPFLYQIFDSFENKLRILTEYVFQVSGIARIFSIMAFYEMVMHPIKDMSVTENEHRIPELLKRIERKNPGTHFYIWFFAHHIWYQNDLIKTIRTENVTDEGHGFAANIFLFPAIVSANIMLIGVICFINPWQSAILMFHLCFDNARIFCFFWSIGICIGMPDQAALPALFSFAFVLGIAITIGHKLNISVIFYLIRNENIKGHLSFLRMLAGMIERQKFAEKLKQYELGAEHHRIIQQLENRGISTLQQLKQLDDVELLVVIKQINLNILDQKNFKQLHTSLSTMRIIVDAIIEVANFMIKITSEN